MTMKLFKPVYSCTVLGERKCHGKSYWLVRCLRCSNDFIAYKWSFSGSGKKCKCGRIHCFSTLFMGDTL